MEAPAHTIQAKTLDWPTGLKAAKEMAEVIGIKEERLLELADTGYAPHWRIDGGPPMFKAAELKSWAAQNLLKQHQGERVPFEVIAVTVPPLADTLDVPMGLSQVEGLRDLTSVLDICSGIYFLCRGPEVVYVGQSVEPAARIANHRSSGKSFNRVFFLPVPKWRLNDVEAAFIRLLRPALNGVTGNGTMRAPATNTTDAEVLAAFMPPSACHAATTGRLTNARPGGAGQAPSASCEAA